MKHILYISILFFSLTVSAQRKHLIKDGEIIQSGIPEKFTKTDGTFYWGGYDKLSESVHYADGWRGETMPVYDNDLQRLGERYYDIGNDVVTWTLIDKILPTLEEAKIAKIKELREAVKGLYNDIQWFIQDYDINDDPVPTVVKDKIKNIRVRYNEFKSDVNSQTTVTGVIKMEVPYDKIELLRQQFEEVY